MPRVNLKESDFDTIADAAFDARRWGDREQAQNLDIIARKISAALTNGLAIGHKAGMSGTSNRISWRDVPSTLTNVV